MARHLLLSLLAATAVACGGSTPSTSGSPSSPQQVGEAKSALQRNTAPTVSDADRATLAADDAAFAADLYRTLSATQPTDNLFLSPHSISIALAMTYAGAKGQTATEMTQALHFSLPQDRLHPAYDWLDLQLSSRGKNATGKDGKPFRLNVSNSLWGYTGSKFMNPFLDTLAVNYDAGLRLVDFVKDPDGSRLAINAWVSGETEQRIRDLIPSGAITDLTRLVLVDAVYFNAGWRNKFDPKNTADATFTRADGSTVQAPMMHETESMPYAAGSGWQAVELPYDGDELGMVVVVPQDRTLADLEKDLTGSTLTQMISQLSSVDVRLSLPKFHVESSFKLRSALESLGMKAAFSGQADFSAMCSSEALYVSDVIHKGYVDVDELGTEAAGATAVLMAGRGIPTEPKVVNASSPFFYFVYDHATKGVVFMGRILDPKK